MGWRWQIADLSEATLNNLLVTVESLKAVSPPPPRRPMFSPAVIQKTDLAGPITLSETC